MVNGYLGSLCLDQSNKSSGRDRVFSRLLSAASAVTSPWYILLLISALLIMWQSKQRSLNYTFFPPWFWAMQTTPIPGKKKDWGYQEKKIHASWQRLRSKQHCMQSAPLGSFKIWLGKVISDLMMTVLLQTGGWTRSPPTVEWTN